MPNNHILTQNHSYNSYYPNPKYVIIGYMDPLGLWGSRRDCLEPRGGEFGFIMDCLEMCEGCLLLVFYSSKASPLQMAMPSEAEKQKNDMNFYHLGCCEKQLVRLSYHSGTFE